MVRIPWGNQEEKKLSVIDCSIKAIVIKRTLGYFKHITLEQGVGKRRRWRSRTRWIGGWPTETGKSLHHLCEVIKDNKPKEMLVQGSPSVLHKSTALSRIEKWPLSLLFFVRA